MLVVYIHSQYSIIIIFYFLYQNNRKWAKENPHWSVTFDKNSPKINVWAAISTKGIYGPIFIPGNIDQETYLLYLADFCDELVARGEFDGRVIFQQVSSKVVVCAM